MIDETTVFTITFKWDPVDCMYHNGVITEYIIQYYKQDRENETIVNSTSMLEYTITDLQPLTTYMIEVAAVNDAGIGIYGNITAKTKSCKLQSFSLLIQNHLWHIICIVEIMVLSKTSTTIMLEWSQANYTAMKTVTISWIMDSLCMYEENVDGETENNTIVAPYVITELKAYSSYIITVCVEDLVCKSVNETTSESGMVTQ